MKRETDTHRETEREINCHLFYRNLIHSQHVRCCEILFIYKRVGCGTNYLICNKVFVWVKFLLLATKRGKNDFIYGTSIRSGEISFI